MDWPKAEIYRRIARFSLCPSVTKASSASSLLSPSLEATEVSSEEQASQSLMILSAALESSTIYSSSPSESKALSGNSAHAFSTRLADDKDDSDPRRPCGPSSASRMFPPLLAPSTLLSLVGLPASSVWLESEDDCTDDDDDVEEIDEDELDDDDEEEGDDEEELSGGL